MSARYRCDDGRFVEVLYGGGRTVVLTIGGSTTDLERTSSTEPNRYSGSGQEWLVSDPRTGKLTATSGDQKFRGTTCKTS